jgi:hypothetical protein
VLGVVYGECVQFEIYTGLAYNIEGNFERSKIDTSANFCHVNAKTLPRQQKERKERKQY